MYFEPAELANVDDSIFQVIVDDFRKFREKSEKDIEHKLIQIWEEEVGKNNVLSFDEILNRVGYQTASTDIGLEQVYEKFAVFYCLNGLLQFEKAKQGLNFKASSVETIKEKQFKLKALQQIEKFCRSDFNLILNQEETIMLRERLLDGLIKTKDSNYWNDICQYKAFHTHDESITSLEGKIKHWLALLGTDLLWPEILILKENTFPSHLTDLLIRIILGKSHVSELHSIMEESSQYADYKTTDENTNEWKHYNDVITIDSPGTMDIDDGISILEVDNNGVKVAIHITNVAHFFYDHVGKSNIKTMMENPIFKEASRRVTSLYSYLHKESHLFRKCLSYNGQHVEQDTYLTVFPMLPPALSENILSLKVGQKLAISYEFHLRHGQDPTLIGVYPSTVDVKENTTYEATESLFENDNEWRSLYDLCRELNEKRVKGGAKSYDNMKYLVPIPSSSLVGIKVSERRSFKSSLVISECAILVSSMMGGYFKENNIPGITKSFDEEKKVSMTEVLSSKSPKPYLQQTSPVRRFCDTINQIQLYLKLTNRLPMTEKQLQSYCDRIDSITQAIGDLEDRITTYWVLQHLRQHYSASERESISRYLTGHVNKQGEDIKKIKLDEETYCSFELRCTNLEVTDVPISFLIESVNFETLSILVKTLN